MRSAFSFYLALPFYVNGNPISSFITPWVRSMWVCQYVVNWVWLSACRALQVNWIFFKDQFVEILNDLEQQDILVLFSRMEYLVLDIDGKHFKKLEDLSRDSLLWESLCGTRVRDAVSVSQSRSEALTSLSFSTWRKRKSVRWKEIIGAKDDQSLQVVVSYESLQGVIMCVWDFLKSLHQIVHFIVYICWMRQIFICGLYPTKMNMTTSRMKENKVIDWWLRFWTGQSYGNIWHGENKTLVNNHRKHTWL